MGLKYYSDMIDAPLADQLRQDNLKTKNQFMVFSDYSWQDFPDTGISTVSNIIFYHGGIIGHGTHVSEPVAQSNADN